MGKQVRIKLRPSLRLKIAASQGYKCFICKNTLGSQFHVDHTVALCLGGADDLSNVNVICPNCHCEKTVDDMQKFYDRKSEIRTGTSRFFNPYSIEYINPLNPWYRCN